MSQLNSPVLIPETTVDTWQEIVDILARIVGIPAALIMHLNGPDIEVFVASDGEENPYHPGDKEHFDGSGLYCETVIKRREKLLIPNALADPEWRDNPDVGLGMISYLGFPVLLPDGTPFGTICILDNRENGHSVEFEKLMTKFRKLVESDLEIVYMNQVLGDKNRQLSDYLAELQALRGLIPVCASCKSIRDGNDEWRPVEHYLLGHPDVDFTHAICPTCMEALYPEHAGEEGG